MTYGSGVFKTDLETVRFVAAAANLDCIVAPFEAAEKQQPRCRSTESFFTWQDWQTAGGGCRITFAPDGYGKETGIAWVHSHSGYAWADVTDEVIEMLAELGARELDRDRGDDWRIIHFNPFIYGWREFVKGTEADPERWERFPMPKY